MTIEIKVPLLPESVADATISVWHKAVGDTVEIDENIVDIETEKVVLEVPSPIQGIIKAIHHPEGDIVTENTIIAILEEVEASNVQKEEVASKITDVEKNTVPESINDHDKLSPAVKKLVNEHGINIQDVAGSGKNQRILKEDIEQHIEQKTQTNNNTVIPKTQTTTTNNAEREERVPMSRLRSTIARRLKQAQDTQAMLTTFNDVNLHKVIELRKQYKESFEKKHGCRLGFMSFFVKATVEALKRFPAVNASIEDNDLVYHNYYDIGIATSSPRGLVVPVIRDIDKSSFAQVEKSISHYGEKAKAGKLDMSDLTGGTFTISNGGVFGSMLSTPIVNPPQSAILGMHRIEQRPIAENGEVVIRPMMYLALTYDHRIIDGKESVLFLKTIKECLEDPARLLLEV